MTMDSGVNWKNHRAQYPACTNGTYLLSSAMSPLHRKVYNARKAHLDMLFEKGDVFWQESVEQLGETRGCFAKLLNCSSEDIGFGYNTSHNMNGVANMLAQITNKRQVVVCRDEFPSSAIPWTAQGFQIKWIESKNGALEPSDYLSAIDENTAAVVASHVQFASGCKNAIHFLGFKLSELKVPFVVNATQSLGVFPIDLKLCQPLAMVASCHKWLGAGYGCSILYLDPGFRLKASWPFKGWLSVEDPVAMDPGASEFKASTDVIETGVPPFNVMAGLGEAAKISLDLGVSRIAERILFLSERLYNGLKALSIEVLSPRDNETDLDLTLNSGIISVCCDNPDDWEQELQQRNIYVSARRGSLRIAVNHFNNEDDIEQLLKALDELLSKNHIAQTTKSHKSTWSNSSSIVKKLTSLVTGRNS